MLNIVIPILKQHNIIQCYTHAENDQMELG